MNDTDLKIKLDLHFKWLHNDPGGEKADLQWADLRGADLRWADLRWADLRGADLQEADLRGADLRGADLQEADLRWADLDISSGIHFACKTFGFKADLRLAAQIAYHFCRIDFGDCQEAIEARGALVDLANKFHRVEECGRIERKKEQP